MRDVDQESVAGGYADLWSALYQMRKAYQVRQPVMHLIAVLFRFKYVKPPPKTPLIISDSHGRPAASLAPKDRMDDAQVGNMAEAPTGNIVRGDSTGKDGNKDQSVDDVGEYRGTAVPDGHYKRT